MRLMSDDANNPFGGFPFGSFGDLSNMFGGGQGDQWAQARQIAASIAGGGETEDNVDPAERIAYEQLARVAELQVTSTTGMRVSDGTPPLIRPATRHEYALNTLDSWRPLLEAMGEAFTQGIQAEGQALDLPESEMAGLPFGADFMAQIMKMMGPMMLSMTAGSMVGQLSRTSLGSYDLPIPRSELDELLVVHANIAEFTEEWSVPTDDMRLWVCLHEYLHHTVLRLPHVSERLHELTRRYVSAFEPNPSGLTDQLGGFDMTNPESMSSLEGLMQDPEALMGVVQSDHQRAMLPEISALLAAIVGWVDHMMDRIGTSLIASYGMLSEALRRRRVTATSADRFLERMIGLELDQGLYDRGRAFVDGVIERGGDSSLARLWLSERELPTPNEIEAPGLWLARIDIDVEELETAGSARLTETSETADPAESAPAPASDEEE